MALPSPSPTLYISGLETKTKKPELRSQLYALFNPYGKILDVVAKKHAGGRGQAFVVFAEQASATAAMRGLSGELFYLKALRITYAKTPSNAILSLTDPSLTRDAAAIQAAKMVVSRAQGEYEQMEKERLAEEELKASGGVGGELKRGLEGGEEREGKRLKGGEEEEEEMEMEMEDDDDEPTASSSARLICTNLPAEANEAILGALFSQHQGYQKSLLLPPNQPLPPSIKSKPTNPNSKSFIVHFGSAEQAKKAEESLQGYLMMPGWEMGIVLDS